MWTCHGMITSHPSTKAVIPLLLSIGRQLRMKARFLTIKNIDVIKFMPILLLVLVVSKSKQNWYNTKNVKIKLIIDCCVIILQLLH